MPKNAVRHVIAQGRLVELAWSEGPMETAILMIWHKDNWISPAVKFFMETSRRIIKRASGYGDAVYKQCRALNMRPV